MTIPHEPVLTNEILSFFQGATIRFFFDGTLGAGGHAAIILQNHPEIELYIGVDRDANALSIAEKRLQPWEKKIRMFQGNYSNMREYLNEARVNCVNAMLIDAGISSMQLSLGNRGFSFQKEGPLDMRMDERQTLTAATIVNQYPEAKLSFILHEYGEEPKARAVARAIVTARKRKKIQTTTELADIVSLHALRKKHLHPATLTFQALRIAVNDELGELQKAICEGIDLLCPDGKIAVISFHRLEDRIVKNCFRDEKRKSLHILTKKPVVPTEEEIHKNPRSRSAKLRVAQKLIK